MRCVCPNLNPSAKSPILNKMNPGYFSLAITALKPQQIPVFLHNSANVWGRRWSPHTSEQKGSMLTHWGQATHICVGKLTIIASDNGLSPERRQAIMWTNSGIFLIRPLGTNFSEIFIGNQTFSFMKMHLKMSSTKWRPFCLGLNVLKPQWFINQNACASQIAHRWKTCLWISST